jgi:hypothetical protein
MARIQRDENGDPVVAAAAPQAPVEQPVRVFEVMVDAIGADAVKGDLVTKDDVTWDLDYLLGTHAIRPAAEYERAYDEEGLRSTSQPKEGQPQQAPVLLQNAPQTQAPATPAEGSVPETPQRSGGPTAAEAAAAQPVVVAPVVEPS